MEVTHQDECNVGWGETESNSHMKTQRERQFTKNSYEKHDFLCDELQGITINYIPFFVFFSSKIVIKN